MRHLNSVAAISPTVCLVLISLGAHARTGLDAPVNTKPTVRSEIRRGYSAAFNCFLETTSDYSAFTTCVNAVQEDNVQKSTLSDPFLLGLSVEALAQANLIKPSESGGWIPIWRKNTARIMKALKLVAKDICTAIESQGCNTFTRIIDEANSQK